MNDLALRVEVVERKKELLERGLQKKLRIPPGWVTAEKVFPAIPHGLLDKALVDSLITSEREDVKSGSDVLVAGMRRICFADCLIYSKLLSTTSVSSKDLQSDVFVLSVTTVQFLLRQLLRFAY